MKNTLDYMVGNTAIQIINKGNKIKIVDVEKQKIKKKFLKKCAAVVLTGVVALGSCLYVVDLQNTKVFLDRQVYILQGEIDALEKENNQLAGEGKQEAVDYEKILARAKELGMDFPQRGQICKYTADKSTAVRVNSLLLPYNTKK